MAENLSSTLDFINKDNLSFIEGLIKLTNQEIDHKEASMIKVMAKDGAFLHQKELKDFDFRFQEAINKEQILDFTTHRFINENEKNCIYGEEWGGEKLIWILQLKYPLKKSISTYFIKCHDLINQLKKVKIQNRLEERIKYLSKYKLLIIDEIGYFQIESKT